ncbi:MAG TPA: hypothetical protein VHO47_05125 [Candidatus Babeliales bacterium]|nr:hypothetical protein [Candidatus Babeliales bacterium]
MKRLFKYFLISFCIQLHAINFTVTDVAAIKKDHRDQINSTIKATHDQPSVPIKFEQLQRLALIQTGNKTMDEYFYQLGTWLGNLSYQRDALTLINDTGKRLQELLAPLKKAVDASTTANATKVAFRNLYNQIAVLMLEYADRLKADGALEIQLAPVKIPTLR